MGGNGLLDAAGQKLVNKITGENKPINYNRDAMIFTKASGTARGTVAQNIADATGVIDIDEEKHPVLSRLLNGKSLADVYQLGMSMQDSAAVAALTVINPVLGKVGAALLGGTAGTQAMLDAVERGATDEQALTMGILSGAFEMLFEKYELDSLLGQGKNFWQAFWRQGLSEAVGEGATEAANLLADVAVMAEKSDWQQNISRYMADNPDWNYKQAAKQAFIDAALQVGEASFGGWISGNTMGGGYSTIQNIAANIQKNQQAYHLYGESQQELVREALELNPYNTYAQKLQGKLDSNKQLSGAQLRKLAAQNDSVIQKHDMQNDLTDQIDKINQKPTAGSVGQLNTTIQAANSQVNAPVTPEDVTNMLKSKRVDSKTAAGITDAIVARLNGQELTKTQRERLSSALGSPAVQSVISDMQKTLISRSDKVSQEPTARNVGQLYTTVQTANDQANASVNQEDVAKRLLEKGFYSKEAAGVAESVAARLNGQELTRTQRSILSSALSSSAVRDTISEFLKKKADGVDSAQNNVYDNIGDGENRYEAVEEDADLHQVRDSFSVETYENGTEVIDNIITDGSHLANGKLKPNVTYKTGEHDYFYTTNEDGLIVNVRTDDLQKKTHEGRLNHNPKTYGKEPGDHAGHLIGDRFGGSPELDNLVSQAKNVNWREYGELENQWANALRNGQKVTVNIDIHYSSGSVRPVSFNVSYTIDGVRHRKIIKNE